MHLLENSSRSWKELSVFLNVIVREFFFHIVCLKTHTQIHTYTQVYINNRVLGKNYLLCIYLFEISSYLPQVNLEFP